MSTLVQRITALRARLARPTLSVEALITLVTVALAVGTNVPFWRSVLAGRAATDVSFWRFAAALAVLFVTVHFLLLATVATHRTVRPLLALAISTGTLAAYFVAHYGIVLDPAMLRNALRTDAREAAELFTPGLVTAAVLALGLAALPWSIRLKPRRLRHAALARASTLGVALLTGTAALLVSYQDLSSLMRNRHELRYLVTPANVVWSLAHVLASDAQGAVAAREPPEPVARVMRPGGGKPQLFVIVVGETARAANFSLNGYPRDTNPALAQLDIVNFSRTTACGTSTEVSLPCMFSPFGRANYDEKRIRRHESALHLLARAGIRVIWLDNQSGCKGVCDGLDARDLSREHTPELCANDHCLDEILLHGLKSVADRAVDTVVVMHQMGNHGPAYFKRYPAAFKRFTPACESIELADCTREQIVNAYDNAIAYTDHVLARTIGELEALRSRFDVALVYASDHGESLGERGLFLHGLPYAIAPPEQIEVPMLWWLAPDTAHALNIDLACLRRRAAEPAAHDNLFHSILGLMSVQTPRYSEKLDLFAPCRNPALPTR